MSFKSNRNEFDKLNFHVKDFLMGNMALDIEVFLKTRSGMPVSNTVASGNSRGGGGHMKAATTHFKVEGSNTYRVVVNKEYAGYQERGAAEDGSRVVRNYSTPGTSSGFFQRSIDNTWRNRGIYITMARRAFNI